MLKLPVYLDNNATTPMDPLVLEAMLPYFTSHFGNAASRTHAYGWQAEEAVNVAREQIAELVNAEPKEIIFTSGATEAANLALKGVYDIYSGKGNHIITVVTEHKAVLDSCAHLERMGADVTYLPVDPDGLIDPGTLQSAIRPSTILIAAMYANNETGVIQPIKEIGAIAKKNGILFFTDATQAVGKIPVDVMSDNIDLMAFSSHKIYGPKGVGALYVRRKNPRVKLAAQIDGGGHERNMRSGTLNVPGIVAFGKACERCFQYIEEDTQRISRLRDKLENALLEIGEVKVNGSIKHRLPNVSNLSFRHTESEALISGFNKNIALSSGSACSSASIEPSYVLTALGLSDELAHSSLRFGLGRFTTEEEINFAIEEVGRTVREMRVMASVAGKE